MSKEWGLIRFCKTDNIYVGCYYGTVDLMCPAICTLNDCYQKENDCYSPVDYCLFKKINIPDKRDIEDLDYIEIWTRYGGGFYWTGLGSEKYKAIIEGCDPWGSELLGYPIDGKPKWAVDFMKKLEEEEDI